MRGVGTVIRRAWFEAWNWLFFHVRLPAAYAWERSKYALLPWVRARRDRTASYGARFGPGWLPFIDVGPGWRPLVARLEADLFRIGWDGERGQIKEKFGALRVYCSGDGRAALWYAIDRAAHVSTRTCETCGAPGRLRGYGWWHTACDKCEAKR